MKKLNGGKRHRIGDDLSEVEQAILIDIIHNSPIKHRWLTAYRIKRGKWEKALNDLSFWEKQVVRLGIVEKALNDPTLAKDTKSVGNAFTAATGIKWKLSK